MCVCVCVCARARARAHMYVYVEKAPICKRILFTKASIVPCSAFSFTVSCSTASTKHGCRWRTISSPLKYRHFFFKSQPKHACSAFQLKKDGGSWENMTSGYPKMVGDLFVMRFPRFAKTIDYDPTVAGDEAGASGDASGFKVSVVVTALAAVVAYVAL